MKNDKKADLTKTILRAISGQIEELLNEDEFSQEQVDLVCESWNKINYANTI